MHIKKLCSPDIVQSTVIIPVKIVDIHGNAVISASCALEALIEDLLQSYRILVYGYYAAAFTIYL